VPNPIVIPNSFSAQESASRHHHVPVRTVAEACLAVFDARGGMTRHLDILGLSVTIAKGT